MHILWLLAYHVISCSRAIPSDWGRVGYKSMNTSTCNLDMHEALEDVLVYFSRIPNSCINLNHFGLAWSTILNTFWKDLLKVLVIIYWIAGLLSKTHISTNPLLFLLTALFFQQLLYAYLGYNLITRGRIFRCKDLTV